MSSTTAAKISDSKESLQAEVPESTTQTMPKRSPNLRSTPSSVTKIINDTAYHEARISGSDLILENFNEIDYGSSGVIHLTTTAFKGAIITGGKISSGARAAPRSLKYKGRDI